MMGQNAHTLNILVEGGADYDFFDQKLRKKFEKKYKRVNIILYAKQLKGIKEESTVPDRQMFLKSLDDEIRKKISPQKSELFNWFNPALGDYILVADMDTFKDLNSRKRSIMKCLPNLNSERIGFAIICIESWYAAGQQWEDRNLLYAKLYDRNPDEINKNHFIEFAIGELGESDWDLRSDMLKHWDISVALSSSPSFSIFWSTFVKPVL